MEYLKVTKKSGYNVELMQGQDDVQVIQLKYHRISLLGGFWIMTMNVDADYDMVERCLMYYLENEDEWGLAMSNNDGLRFKSEWLQKWLKEV